MHICGRRSPHGERGLKFSLPDWSDNWALSLPSRGAWIEIPVVAALAQALQMSLPSRGAWIEIHMQRPYIPARYRRSPHGERGLKYVITSLWPAIIGASLPSRGAWIEIILPALALATCRSLPSRGAWIEMALLPKLLAARGSLPSRGAWIENIPPKGAEKWAERRSPHGERGLKTIIFHTSKGRGSRSPHGERGLKKHMLYSPYLILTSLPSRGAWIENISTHHPIYHQTSLPSRGAWIENSHRYLGPELVGGRSPHGERGLKIFGHFDKKGCPDLSLPSRGAWIEKSILSYHDIDILVAPLTGSVD